MKWRSSLRILDYDYKEKYLASGMDGYVSKPIDRNLLYDEIVSLVSQRFKN